MPFVKLDCEILNSTLWFDRDAREVFLTALLMAEPHELLEAAHEIATKTLDRTGWEVPKGWYGMVHAAGVGIVRRAGIDKKPGMDALERLASPEADSRSADFDGRRLVRIDGGFIVLNWARYREKDHTSAERSKRYRERKASRVAVTPSRVMSQAVTQAEAEAEAEVKNTHTEVAPTALVGVGVVAVKGNSKGVSRGYADVVSRITQLFADVATSGRKAVTVSDAQELQADMIFAYWAGRLNHETAMLDTKRVHRLKARLTENKGNVHELLFAVDGARKDDHLMGRNGNGRKYDGIETIFRDRGQVERLAEMGGYKSGIEHPQAAKYAAICALP